MITLLGKTRQINRLLQRSESVEYDGISRVLSNVLEANVYITDEGGRICGYAFYDDNDDLMTNEAIELGQFPRKFVDWLNRLEETRSNIRVGTDGASFEKEMAELFHEQNIVVTPIYGPRRRLGTLVVSNAKKEFGDPDLLLSEYGATVVGMEMLRDRTQQIEIEAARGGTDRRRDALVLRAQGGTCDSAGAREPGEVRGKTHRIANRRRGEDHALGYCQCTPQVRVRRRHRVEVARHEGHLCTRYKLVSHGETAGTRGVCR